MLELEERSSDLVLSLGIRLERCQQSTYIYTMRAHSTLNCYSRYLVKEHAHIRSRVVYSRHFLTFISAELLPDALLYLDGVPGIPYL